MNGDGGGRILLIDDRTVYREALAMILGLNGIAGLRSAWDMASIIAVLESNEISVILLSMATRGLPELLHAVSGVAPGVPVIAVAVSEFDERGIIACAEAGVAGYHMRTDSFADLLTLVNHVVNGRVSCPPNISAILLRRLSALASERVPATRDPALTVREAQILRMLELGRSNQDIAAQLSIAVHTVKNHVHNLLTKLGVRTRTEAAALSRTLQLGPDVHGRTRSGSTQNWLR